MRAAELAAVFEVTTRTIERDLLALQEAGVPIWARPGPGGGYGINVEATLPPLNLTSLEAAALATALAAARSMPFAEAGRSAMRKLAAAMAAAPRDEAARFVQAIRVVPGPDGEGGPAVEVIQRSIAASVALELDYRDREGRATTRVVEPLGIVGSRNGWYLAAWCRLRQAPRAFRLDRIARANPTGEAFLPRPLESVLPDLPFDLAEPNLP